MMTRLNDGPATALSNSTWHVVQHIVGNAWAKSVVRTAGARVMVLVLGLGSTVALARGLGPDGRGVYGLTMTLATLGLVAVNFGFPTANTLIGSREASKLPTLVSNTLVMASAVGALGVVLVASLWVFGVTTSALSLVLLLLAVAWLPVGVVFLQLQPLLLTQGQAGRFSLAESGWQLTSVALVVALWLTDTLTPASAFAVVLAAFGLGAMYVTRAVRQGQPFAAPSLTLWRRMLPSSAGSWGVQVSSIALARLDVLAVGSLLGTRVLGLYLVAVTVCEAIMVLPGTVAALLLPKLAAIRADEHRSRATRQVLAVTALGMAGVVGLTAVVAEPAVRLVFGVEYGEATAALYWLLPGIALFGVHTVAAHHLLAVGAARGVITAQSVGVVLNLGLAFLLLQPLGLAGAGLASTISYGVVLAMTTTKAIRRSPRSPASCGERARSLRELRAQQRTSAEGVE